MFGGAGNDVLPEEAVLLGAMVGDAPLFENFRVDGTEIEADALPNRNRCAKCQPVQIPQSLCLDVQPVAKVTECFERLHLDRIVIRDAVVARIRKQGSLDGSRHRGRKVALHGSRRHLRNRLAGRGHTCDHRGRLCRRRLHRRPCRFSGRNKRSRGGQTQLLTRPNSMTAAELVERDERRHTRAVGLGNLRQRVTTYHPVVHVRQLLRERCITRQ